MKSTSTRCALLDELRGLDLISMMLYHGMWDLVYLFGVRAPWYGSWQGELWQQSICWVFILLSGMLGSARIIVKQHTLKEVGGGFLVGLFCGIIGILFI